MQDKEKQSFICAMRGWIKAMREERHLRFHSVVAVLVLVAATLLDVSRVEVAILCLTIALVLVAELINTAIEKYVDFLSIKKHPKAAFAKDVAAGAVLVAAFFSVLIGIIIFYPYIRQLF